MVSIDPTVQMSIDKRIFFTRDIINYNQQIVKNGHSKKWEFYFLIFSIFLKIFDKFFCVQ